jgi:hypothetical protein
MSQPIFCSSSDWPTLTHLRMETTFQTVPTNVLQRDKAPLCGGRKDVTCELFLSASAAPGSGGYENMVTDMTGTDSHFIGERFGETILRTLRNYGEPDNPTTVAQTEVTAGGETSQEADVFTFRDGEIVKAQSYGDTAMQERIFGSKRVAAG